MVCAPPGEQRPGEGAHPVGDLRALGRVEQAPLHRAPVRLVEGRLPGQDPLPDLRGGPVGRAVQPFLVGRTAERLDQLVTVRLDGAGTLGVRPERPEGLGLHGGQQGEQQPGAGQRLGRRGEVRGGGLGGAPDERVPSGAQQHDEQGEGGLVRLEHPEEEVLVVDHVHRQHGQSQVAPFGGGGVHSRAHLGCGGQRVGGSDGGERAEPGQGGLGGADRQPQSFGQPVAVRTLPGQHVGVTRLDVELEPQQVRQQVQVPPVAVPPGPARGDLAGPLDGQRQHGKGQVGVVVVPAVPLVQGAVEEAAQPRHAGARVDGQRRAGAVEAAQDVPVDEVFTDPQIFAGDRRIGEFHRIGPCGQPAFHVAHERHLSNRQGQSDGGRAGVCPRIDGDVNTGRRSGHRSTEREYLPTRHGSRRGRPGRTSAFLTGQRIRARPDTTVVGVTGHHGDRVLPLHRSHFL
ncbi:hypothetical protein JD81_02600 [Micromonospora sagamiensis]|uniref:Uncharacterized protein n=1 Tax=Micromonospora sagamiensis TaxID=47875 RepID=A0A562WHS2_9ACTN|nr:hypothetical protein JD81_02600 [Micromonospora sagamiensis]